jgi:site-specific DNA recombinase
MTMSQSQYYSSKLSKDVKRGNDKKLKLGWKLGCAPTGYLNTPELNKGSKIIIDDPERYEVVKQMWQLMLTGNYSVPEVLDVATIDWGYTTRQRKRTGGKPISRSALYGMFTNPFYAGLIRHNGELHQGSHNPMITLAEYDRVQTILGRKGRPRPKTHSFAYRGLMTCGECGCAITAETKTKYIKSTGETKEYTYYHCTRKRPCSQRSSISENQVEQQVVERLSSITIIPEFRDWALEVLRSNHETEVVDREAIQRSQTNAVIACQRQLDNLTSMRLKDLLSDDEYVEQRERLSNELRRHKETLHDTELRGERWLELTERAFDFATNARHLFSTGTEDDKRRIFSGIGGNITLVDSNLKIEYHPWFTPIAEKYPEIARAFEEVRTKKFATSKEKKAAFAAINSSWLPIIEDVITIIRQDLSFMV